MFNSYWKNCFKHEKKLCYRALRHILEVYVKKTLKYYLFIKLLLIFNNKEPTKDYRKTHTNRQQILVNSSSLVWRAGLKFWRGKGKLNSKKSWRSIIICLVPLYFIISPLVRFDHFISVGLWEIVWFVLLVSFVFV